MENNIINTLKKGERVTSTYAEIYFDDEHCDYQKTTSTALNVVTESKTYNQNEIERAWMSPSDLLIGILDLTPPFTSKITRGITHEGILAIGNEVLTSERAKFTKRLKALIDDNEAAWAHILEHEKEYVDKKVQDVYGKILVNKTKIMNDEISKFYENTLDELELTMKANVNKVLVCTYGSIVSKLNVDIKEKLKNERVKLEDLLQKRYESEVVKIKRYYKLLLNNELLRNNSLIDKAIIERNDALKAFYRQIEAENITATMYILCTERKKCRIKQFVMDNYQSLELTEKYQKIKERQDIINIFKERDVPVSYINKEWEDKIKKILQIFLKFIGFSLKLLPEQTAFLLDFEKMVVLQLNEIQKMPIKVSSILVDEEKFKNIFKFEDYQSEKDECVKEPFVIVGDLSDTPPPRYGSRETLPDDVDLPTVRVQRQFVYAKCHKYEEIKDMLESERCKCSDIPIKQSSLSSPSSSSKPSVKEDGISVERESSNEPLLIEEIKRLDTCPIKNCKDWAKRETFPYLNSYLDFDDEKYERVKAILGKLPKRGATPVFVDPKTMAYGELPFSATKEPYHTVGTQYSSQEELNISDMECSCLDNFVSLKQNESGHKIKENPSITLNEILNKRKVSLRRLLQQNPTLLEMFTDECFEFQF